MSPTQEQLDSLLKLVTQGIDQGAGELNALLGSEISLSATSIQCPAMESIPTLGPMENNELCLVSMAFNGSLEGVVLSVFSSQASRELVSRLTGNNEVLTGIDTLEAGTLSEVGNTILNGVMTTLSKMLDLHFVYQVPDFHQGEYELVQHMGHHEEQSTLIIHVDFRVEELTVKSGIHLVLNGGSLAEMLVMVDSLAKVEV